MRTCNVRFRGQSGHDLLRCTCPLMTQSEHLLTVAQWTVLAGVQERNPDAHVFCASAKDTANSNLVYDRDQPTPVVDSVGDPLMPFGHVADVDAAMPKRHGMLIAVICKFANEFDRVARSDLLVDITAAINSRGDFAFEPAIQVAYDCTLLSARRASASARRRRCRAAGDIVRGRSRNAWIVGSMIKGQATRVQENP